MRRFLPIIIVAVVGLAAPVGGTLLYLSKRQPIPKVVKDQLAAAHSLHELGPRDAPVTLEEFADLQCPPCGALSEPINALEKSSHGRLRVVFRHFPLAMHLHAREAAWATEAAGLQGQFWPMHDLLYREQTHWSQATEIRPLFEGYAGQLGLDVERFRKDLGCDEVKALVAADEQRGSRLGVQFTPIVFVNDVAVPGASLSPEHLQAVVETALKSSETIHPH